MNPKRNLNRSLPDFADLYLEKHTTGKKYLDGFPARDLKYIVVIPAFNESGLLESLDSLFKCEPVGSAIEILIVINYPYESDRHTIEKNYKIGERAEQWAVKHNTKRKSFHIIYADPDKGKNSGVGFARKTGMDEAIRRFKSIHQSDGIILSMDADATVEKNYFSAIENHFARNSDTGGCSIYFEHPLDGPFSKEVYDGIAQYELHQRYYLRALRYSGHPNAWHTVGSCFAVRAKVYCEQGGMNRRQAGEDFYFLQKVFDAGPYSECRQTTVYPSPRPSDRVVFGTGPVVWRYLSEKKEFLSYNPELFVIMRSFLRNVNRYYENTCSDANSFIDQSDPVMEEFLKINTFSEKFKEINGNSSGVDSFRKRFFRWFNMFRVLKYINHGRKSFPDIPVRQAAENLLRIEGIDCGESSGAVDLLKIYRKLEKMGN